MTDKRTRLTRERMNRTGENYTTAQRAVDFEKKYADDSGMTIEQLHGNGLFAVRCHCGDSGCKGWKIVHRSSAEFEE